MQTNLQGGTDSRTMLMDMNTRKEKEYKRAGSIAGQRE